MSNNWNYAAWQAAGREADVSVPGGVLRCRLSGPETAAHTVVFENGWSGSLSYAVWLEQALSSKVRVLLYDRAGIGDSRSSAPITAEAMTQQFVALLDALDIQGPVVVAGHSYGGLIAALHAAQTPQRVSAIVQIDNTPEFDDPVVDVSWHLMPLFGRILQLSALMGYDKPLFDDIAREIPPEIFVRVRRGRRWLMRSLAGSIVEIRLLNSIRHALAAGGGARECPRLVISSTPPPQKRSFLQKRFYPESKMQALWEAVTSLHQRQAALNGSSRWVRLPYKHVSLVSDRTAASEVAGLLLNFIGEA